MYPKTFNQTKTVVLQMEAIPRLPMLSVELKVNSAIDDSTEFKVETDSLRDSIKLEINKVSTVMLYTYYSVLLATVIFNIYHCGA